MQRHYQSASSMQGTFPWILFKEANLLSIHTEIINGSILKNQYKNIAATLRR